GKLRTFLMGLAAAAALMIGPALAADAPDKAKIDWQQFKGQSLELFFVKHPWTDAITPLLPEFEKLTGIKLNLTTAAEDAYWNKSSLGLASSKPPFDVFFLSMGINGYTAYSNNWLVQMNPLLDNPKLTDPAWYKYDDISKAAAAAFHLPDPSSSKVYGIPMSTEVYMFFYRKDLFKESGIDVDSITTMAQWMDALHKLKLPDGVYPASLRGGGLGILDELNGMVANAWGNTPYLKDRFVYFDEKWAPRFTDPKVKEGFKLWADLMKLSAPGVTSFDWYEATTQFAQGKAATFGPDASLFASIFLDPAQSTVADKVGFKALPAASPDGAHTAMWSWGLSIPEKSAKKDAAWLFLEWATSPYVTEQVSLKTLASSRQSTWNSADYQAKLPEGFGNAVGQSLAIAQPSIMYLTSADQVVQNMLDALQAIYGGTPVDEAMQKLQDQATEIVKQAGLYKP
ncbi:MAG: extracellular solute-binding protein, partial [Hypericibacter sp.]